MRTPNLILIGISAILLLSTAHSQDQVQTSQKEADESIQKILELRNERIGILKEVVNLGNKLAKGNRIEITDALEARMKLLNAERDLAIKPADHIKLCKDALDSLKEYEEIAKAILEAGRGTHLNLLKIKATCLEVEVVIEQARLDEAK